ncbi:MAG: exo-alpha-sialidase, partial [Saprospiraceae bacterium]|nr:exo-alpha-sialidase [Saprospiraceae bacterium]
MRSTIISLLILVFFTFCSLAQNPSDYWNEVHPPWGGTVQLTQLPSGTLYAQHPTKRAIFRSGDEGQNWTTLTHFADNPDLDFTFFTIGHAGGFYYKSNVWHKSNNEGASWTPLSNATSSFLRLVEMPSGTLIAYGNDNLFRSTDGGQTWAAVYPNGLSFISSSSLYLEIFPDQSIVLKAYGTNNLIFRSTDDGQTWTQRGLGQDYELEMITPDGAFILYNASGAPNLVNELVRQQLPSSPLVHVGDFLPITGYHFLSSGRILMSADEDLFYSDDDGLTWTVFHSSLGEIEHELIPNVQLTDGSFFCNVLDALHKSSDGGLTMNFSARGIDKPTVEQIRFLSDSSYMVSLPTGIWKTANKGANWNRILTEPSGDFEITPAGGILSLSNRKLFYAPPGSSQFTNISPTTSGIFAY